MDHPTATPKNSPTPAVDAEQAGRREDPSHDHPFGSVAARLRDEKVGGVLLLVGAVAALIWANSPWREAYAALSDVTVGPAALHLDLSLATWAADALLAVFFFVVGVELKAEFVNGSLRRPARAAAPILAAIGGMVVPALIFTGVIVVAGEDALRGWAVPTATDIAFALAVLAVVGKGLPVALRTFLLTLAVVDDLLAITVIAIFYTAELAVMPLLAALLPLAAFGVAVQRRMTSPWLLIPLAAITWALVHESGIHATVAGVLLGFTVPALTRAGETVPLTTRIEHAVKPFSAALALPVFAFFAAGVSVVDSGGIASALTEPVAVAVASGLVIGKVVGIWGTTTLLTRFTTADAGDGLGSIDVLGVSLLAGIGFTVSLLIGDLAFGAGTPQAESAKIAVITASVVAALLAALVLRLRARAQATPGG